MTRVDIINSFIEKRAYRSYLEVSSDATVSFDAIKCKSKRRFTPGVGSGSDDFFAKNSDKFDVIFVDGVHQCEQALRDIQNAIAALSPHGVVVVHDCLPPTAEMASDVPITGGRPWCGDVFRAVSWFFSKSRYMCYAVAADLGVGVIDTSRDAIDCIKFPHASMLDLTYEEFSCNRVALAHIVSDTAFGGLLALPSGAEDAVVHQSKPVTSAPVRLGGRMRIHPAAGRTCVVYVTDGNQDDVSRLSLSARSLVQRSSLAVELVVLSNTEIPATAILGVSDVVPYHNYTDMYDVLHSVGLFRERWNRKWPFEVLYRLGVPLHGELRKYSRILYLDTDTLVLSDGVDRFIDADLDGFEVGGVYDIDGDEHGRIPGILRNDLRQEYAEEVIADLGCSVYTRAYVNAGVLLMNNVEIQDRLDWYVRRLCMFWEAECRGRFRYLDQDFVNSMMRVRSDFSPMFNWQRGGYPGCCVIRHYIAGQKREMAIRAKEDGLV